MSTKYYLPEFTKTSIGMGRDGFKLQSLQEGVAARGEGVTGVRGMLYFALNYSCCSSSGHLVLCYDKLEEYTMSVTYSEKSLKTGRQASLSTYSTDP